MLLVKNGSEKDTLMVTMAKKLSHNNIEDFKNKLNLALQSDIENVNVLFDFERLTTIDYFGLKQLIEILKSIKEKKGNVLLVSLKPHLIRLFNKIGINQVVPVL